MAGSGLRVRRRERGRRGGWDGWGEVGEDVPRRAEGNDGWCDGKEEKRVRAREAAQINVAAAEERRLTL